VNDVERPVARNRAVVFLTGDGTASQFTRFVFVGGVSSGFYALLFLLLSRVGSQTANLIGVLVSTMVANEMHRRLTFHAGGRVTFLTGQIEGGGLALVGLAASSGALAAFDRLYPDASAWAQLLLLAAVTGTIGLVRFVVLRLWVFRSPPAEAPTDGSGPDPTGPDAAAPDATAPDAAGPPGRQQGEGPAQPAPQGTAPGPDTTVVCSSR